MTVDVEQLLATPAQHFLSFDGDHGLFVPMDRDAYFNSAFLDGRAKANSSSPLRRPLEPLIAAAGAHQAPQTGWIFHLARTGSTLLSRLIDNPQSSLVLREPPPLRQLGLAAAADDRSSSWQGRLVLAHSMAARRFEPNRPTVVKANVPVNFMLDELLRLDPAAPAILLYLPLEPYLLAVLRGFEQRTWVGRISDQLGPVLSAQVGLSQGASIPVRAAALWLAQMLAFQALLAANPAAASLDAGQLFSTPAAAGEAAAAHLGVADVDVRANAAAYAGHYAKDPAKPYDEAERQRLADENRVRLADEITAARSWIESCAAAGKLPTGLARPLAGTLATALTD